MKKKPARLLYAMFLLVVAVAILSVTTGEAQERNWDARFEDAIGTTTDFQPVIDYDWPADIPTGVEPAFDLTAEATVTASDGVYSIRVTGTDRARLYLDGTRIIDAWSGGARETEQQMQAGRGYQLYLESAHGDGTETAVEWRAPDSDSWVAVPARDSDTASFCDVSLSWSAPTLRENGTPLDPDTELDRFKLYRGICGSSADPEHVADIDAAFRSTSKDQVIPPGQCYAYYLSAVDLDGLEGSTDMTERRCDPVDQSPPAQPVFEQ